MNVAVSEHVPMIETLIYICVCNISKKKSFRILLKKKYFFVLIYDIIWQEYNHWVYIIRKLKIIRYDLLFSSIIGTQSTF